MIAAIQRLFLPAFVALRLVRSRRSSRLSTVTVVSMVGVAFGVMALTIVLGVTSGFQDAFQTRILGLYPHIVLLKRSGDFRDYEAALEDIRSVPGVAAATPATYDDMMMAAGVHRAGAVIKGVDTATVDEVVNVGALLIEGSLDSLREAPTVRWEGATVSVHDPVAATWLTVVAREDASGALTGTLLHEDRTPPDPGHARVTVLDLRGVDQPTRVAFERVGHHDVDPPPVVVAPTVPGGLTAAREMKAGDWLLEATGETIALEAETVVTVVLLSDGAKLASRLMVEPGRLPTEDGTAMVRVFNAARPGAGGPDQPQGRGTTISLGGLETAELSGPIGPREFTGFHATTARLPGLLIGTALAKRLDAKLGTEITIVTPLRGVDNKMMGPYGMAPSSARHVVTGIFESGFHEYDVRLGLVNIDAAQRFLNRGKVVRWLEVKATDILRVKDVKRRVATALDPYDVETLAVHANRFQGKIERYVSGDVRDAGLEASGSFIGGVRNSLKLATLLKYQETDFGYRPRYRLIDWEEMNANLFSALKLQKVVLTIFFLIIIIVGSFVVVGSQIMIIHEKAPDIAILKAMGATSGTIRAVFTLQGLFVAGLGTLFGLALGFAACAILAAVDYRLDASVYLIDRLPVEVDVANAIVVAVATAVCTLAATQYSAARAAAKTPVEGLRAVD